MLNQLVRDAAVVLSVVLIVNYLKNLYADLLGKYEAWLLGLVYAFAGVFSMKHPYVLSESGVQFDPRAAFVGLAALFGGWIGAVLTGGTCILYRLYLGGTGAVAGSLAIFLTAVVGVGSRHFIFRNNRLPRFIDLILYAILLSIISLSTLLHLPGVRSSFSALVFSSLVTALYLFICVAFGIFEVQEIKRRRREKDLKEAEILFESAQSVGQIGVLMYLPEMREYRLSSQVYRMIGVEAEAGAPAAVGIDFFEHVHPEDAVRVREILEEESKGHVSGPFQFRLRQNGGDERIVWSQSISGLGDSASGNGLSWNDDGPVVAWLLHDVTERSQLHDQLAHSAKLATLGELASTIGHEINNPLTSAILLGDAIQRRLRQRGLLETDISDLVTRLNQRLSGISSVIRSMTSFVRLESTSQTVIDAHGVIMDTVGLFRELVPEGRLEIEIDLLANRHQITGAASRLQQVLMNLLTNARDATAEIQEPRVRIETREEGEQFVIRVTDNGAGMSDEVRQRLFEPFFTTKERGRGTGLGLSVVSSIVSHMKGRIEVHSAPLKGAEFRLMFPITRS